MARRTKAELEAANYYEWLKVTNELRAKKKSGVKLTPEEKTIIRTIPTPEAPYGGTTEVAQQAAIKKEQRLLAAQKKVIDFDKNVVWPTRGGAFLCAVFNVPYTDEQCMIFCSKEDCPFHGIGYFRAHGQRF